MSRTEFARPFHGLDRFVTSSPYLLTAARRFAPRPQETRMRHIRYRSFFASALIFVVIGVGFALKSNVNVGVQPDGRILIPNGRALTPAGEHIEVNDRPLGMVLSPNGKLLAVVTGSNFNPRALHIIDTASRTLKQTISIANSFVGVAFSLAADRIYVG